MEFSLNTFSLALLVSAIASASVAILTYQRRKVNGATVMFWIAVALTFWSLAYSIENLNPDLGWHRFWIQVQFISIPFIPVLWLIFAIQYTQQNKAPSLSRMALLFLVPASAVLMAWTNELHHLFWADMKIVILSGVSMLAVTFGPYFIFYAIYSYAAIFLGIFFFSRHAFQVEAAYRSQAFIMLAAVVVFISGNGLYLLDLLPFKGLDITAFSFTFSSIILSYGLFRHHLLDLMPIANEIILQNIGDGVLVLDSQKRIIFINPAFEQMAGLLPDTSVGSPVNEVLFNWPDLFTNPGETRQVEAKITLGDSERILQVEISPIWHREALQGGIYVIHDITERATQEEKMRLFLDSREKIQENFIFMAIDNTNSTILDVNSSFSLVTGYTPEEVIGKSILGLNLVSVETRALLNRILLTSPGIYDMEISVRAKNRQMQDWNLSISTISLNETSFKVWVAQPTQGDIATRPIS